MKVNIYYGGRGVLDDPTIYVINKMQQVLTELRVNVQRYNIYEYKKEISTLPQTMKDADGVILATTVEWLGIGGFMTQFLDACWLYADKDKLSNIYMQPVVISTTYGEREGLLTLENAWEILGGQLSSGLCGYVENLADFENSTEYARIIDKKAEGLYRAISQQVKGLPASNQAVTKTVQHAQKLELTPQESEQLSQYASNDEYVQQQKVDIEELSSMYRSLLGQDGGETPETEYIASFKSHFAPQKDFVATYLFQIDGKPKALYIGVNQEEIDVHYGYDGETDVFVKVSPSILDTIISGRETFQRAFGVGDMTARGNLKTLHMLDTIFTFNY